MIKLIKNGLVITMDSKRNKQYEKLDIVIENEMIKEVTTNYTGEYDLLIDAQNKIAMPGLINCHTHLGMSIFRATNDNLNLNDWLTKKIWPIEAKMTDEDIYSATLLSCLEMIKTGTTTNNDMYFGWKKSINAIKETKIRQVFTRFLIGNNDQPALAKIADFLELYNTYKNEKLITFTVAPHSLYTCNKEYLLNCKKIADQLSLPIHLHFSENEVEVKTVTELYHQPPVHALKELGFLENKLILAHGTYLNEAEQQLLKGKDVSICHNPVSNLNLGCGVADITNYLKNNINVCLGTDGQGSGNNLNMFYHMSLVDQLQKAKYQDPTVMNSYQVLTMATINGAKALGLEKEIGSIEVGKKADLIILDLNNIEIYPTADLISQIVHNVESNNIDTTIINGEILMQNHKLTLNIDEENLKKEITTIIEKLY